MSGERAVPAGRRRRAFQRLRRAPLNFRPPASPGEPPPGDGWRFDTRIQPLAPEPPGDPVADGTWAVARRLMRGYEFADPSMVHAYYDDDAPLRGRTMLLEVRFFVLRFLVGCRVADVYERTEEVEGREARVWGWAYQTLEGHFEEGEMSWEVVKWPASGEVAFRLRAWSRRASSANPIVRLGFRVVGRREQVRFYDSTCERMRRLTDEALLQGSRAEAVRRVSGEVTARGAAGTDHAHEQLGRNVELEEQPR